MRGPRVRVELGLGPRDSHVWVGDVDIANLITGIRIEAGPHQFPTVSIGLIADEVLVDGELIEAIQPVLVRPEATP